MVARHGWKSYREEISIQDVCEDMGKLFPFLFFFFFFSYPFFLFSIFISTVILYIHTSLYTPLSLHNPIHLTTPTPQKFLTLIATQSQAQAHHPEWSNVYNVVFVRWTTHSPPGLGPRDLAMARFCDEMAVACGEEGDVFVVDAADAVEGEGYEGETKGTRDLLNRLATQTHHCCVPKSKS